YVDSGGLCGIHKYREAVCSTWFCRHNRAAAGRNFWLAMLNLLRAIERSLAWWCIDRSDLDVDARLALTSLEQRPQKLDRFALAGRARQAQRGLWGRYAGREAEFFKACAARVEGLGAADVLTIGGAPVGYLVRLVKELHGKLADPTLPERVLRGQQVLVQI